MNNFFFHRMHVIALNIYANTHIGYMNNHAIYAESNIILKKMTPPIGFFLSFFFHVKFALFFSNSRFLALKMPLACKIHLSSIFSISLRKPIVIHSSVKTVRTEI